MESFVQTMQPRLTKLAHLQELTKSGDYFPTKDLEALEGCSAIALSVDVAHRDHQQGQKLFYVSWDRKAVEMRSWLARPAHPSR